MFLLFIALLNTCLLITCYILFQFFLFGVNALFCFTCIKGLIFFAYIICILYFSVLKSTFYPRTSSAFRLFAICSLLCTPEWHLHFGFSQFEVYFAPQNGICISAFSILRSISCPIWLPQNKVKNRLSQSSQPIRSHTDQVCIFSLHITKKSIT